MRKRAEFLYVQKGRRAARGDVLIEARARPGATVVRFGVTASRKVGGAVVRNRAKRRLREIARQLLPLLGAPGVDYVLVARAGTADAPWARLLDDAQSALIRLRTDLARAATSPPSPPQPKPATPEPNE